MRRIVWKILGAVCCLILLAPSAMAGEVSGLTVEASSYKSWGAPSLLVDGDTATAWVGGSTGVGPGKRLVVTLPGPRTIARLRIANGNQASGEFKKFRCITAGILLLPDHAVRWFTLKPQSGWQDVFFPPVEVSSFEILIAEVSKPVEPPKDSSRDKVAVSEIRVYDTADGGLFVESAKPPASSRVATASAPSAKSATQVKASKEGMDYFAAAKPGLAWLKTSVPAKKTQPKPGKSDASVPPWMKALVCDYYQGLVSMDDRYLNVFPKSLRERENRGLAVVRAEQSKGKLPFKGRASGDGSGLGIGKPIVRGNTAMVPVRGTYLFTAGGKRYMFGVNAQFSFAREGDGWRINGVLSR